MRIAMHYLPARRFEESAPRLRQAIEAAHARGKPVAIGTGAGMVIVPPGYALETAMRDLVTLRAPCGMRVICRPR